MALELEILFEDQDLVVINKPPGLVVNRAGTVAEQTVQDWFEARYLSGQQSGKPSSTATATTAHDAAWQELVPAAFDAEYGSPTEIFSERQGMVHRLDKDTSGALVLAKNPGSLVKLLASFRHREVHKQYTCLVHGKFRVNAGTIQAPIERATFDRQRFAISATGRPAETDYEVVGYFPRMKADQIKAIFSKDQQKKLGVYQGFSLVHCWPKTGRTHQIRVHLQHWHHPIVGDDKYVGKKRAKLDEMWLPRQFLHASQLEFAHPRSGELIKITAPLTADLNSALDLLETD